MYTKNTGITTNGTYELDKFDKLKYNKYIPFTDKNRNFIEGCIKLDSSYASKLSNIVKGLGFDFKTTLKESIVEINRVNRTRLSKAEMDEINDRLLAQYSNELELKTAIDNDTEGLFKLIGKSISFKSSKGKTITRTNVSFATKFIFYMSKELGCSAHTKYTKYDSVVAENLSHYLDVYAINKNKYTKKDFLKFKDINDSWDMFINKYNPSIQSLLDEAKKDHILSSLTLDELDHVIWYTQK